MVGGAWWCWKVALICGARRWPLTALSALCTCRRTLTTVSGPAACSKSTRTLVRARGARDGAADVADSVCLPLSRLNTCPPPPAPFVEKNGSDWAKKQLETMDKMSPLSMHITFEQMQRGATLDLAGCLKMEYGIVQHIMVRVRADRVERRCVFFFQNSAVAAPPHSHWPLLAPSPLLRAEGHRLLPGRARK